VYADEAALKAASMGPPKFIGGNWRGLCGSKGHGRGFNGAAEIHRRKYEAMTRSVMIDNPLQWGRRNSSAEMSGMPVH